MLTDCMYLEKIEGESLIAIKDCVELTVRLTKIGVTAEIGQVQKTVLLGMARILRKVLAI